MRLFELVRQQEVAAQAAARDATWATNVAPDQWDALKTRALMSFRK